MKKEIIALDEFQKEFEELIKRYVPKRRRDKLISKYESLINSLAVEGEKVLVQPYFEKLKGTGDVNLYALRLEKKNPNIRIIFSFYENYVVFLCAFLEKKSSDYDRAINNAEKRLQKITGIL